jgi:alpha-tubulin suppressor-like RCC1 family protein
LLPTEVNGDLEFAGLDAGTSHVCGVTVQGQVYCWGSNESGQLGDGSRIDRPVPTPVRVRA